MIMKPRTLASRTDLAVLGPSARVEDRGGYLVVRCLDNPGFIWGNFLLFDRPPAAGDVERWCRLYDEAFGDTRGILNRAFLWDCADGAVGAADEFVRVGFSLERSMVLSCRQAIRPAKWNEGLEIRPIEGDGEYAACVEMQVASRPSGFTEEDYRSFRCARMKAYRAMVDAGQGTWYGAFYDGRLVGDLGLFMVDGVGRYQFVTTAPDFRRRHVCSTLIATTAQAALAGGAVDTLVIVADSDDYARVVYESVGFSFAEWQVGLTAPIGRGQMA